MARLLQLAGGIVEPGAGQAGFVSAYVVLSAGRDSRVFKVSGPVDAPAVVELDAATTIDLGRFQAEVDRDLRPALEAQRAARGAAAVAVPKAAWVCGLVEKFLLAQQA